MMKKQIQYCLTNSVPMFAPKEGRCYYCNKVIEDTDDRHITGCPHCDKSFCE